MSAGEAAGTHMQTVEWLDLYCEVPDDWEIVRHAVSRQKGSLAFVDRRHERLRLFWSACSGRPDVQLLVNGCRERDRQERPGARFTALEPLAGWQGYCWEDAGQSVTRAGTYDEVHGRWVEMVFTWPGRPDRALERAVLASFRSMRRANGECRYRAFGLDLTVPGGWELEKAEVFPADLRIRFRARGNRAEVRRVKMADMLGDDSLDGLMRRELGRSRACLEATTYAGHEARRAREGEPVLSWRWITGWSRRRARLLWVCPARNWMYAVSTDCRPGAAVAPEAFTVRCCGMEAA